MYQQDMAADMQIRARIVSHMKDQFGLPEQQVETMLPMFLTTLREHLADLEIAVAGGKSEDIVRVAHRLKGALLNLGLEESAREALTIEYDARNNSGQTGHIRYKAQMDDLKILRDNLPE